MRKLPVFLLIDVSESIAGPSHAAIAAGVEDIVATLRRDPQALETAQLSIIVFAGRARVLTPMMELATFYPPELPIGGGTALGDGLTALMAEIDAQVRRGGPDRKGDWAPLVFLMTDGRPTDDPSAAIERWRRDYAPRAQMVAVSTGGGADHALLRRLTDNVIVLTDESPDSYRRFLNWISQSIAVRSRAVGALGPARGIDLSKDLPAGAVSLDKAALHRAPAGGMTVDERLAIFVARCQHGEEPYLIRYERAVGADPRRVGDARFILRQTLPLKPSYFELCGDKGPVAGDIDVSELAGNPGCPHCGTRIGMVFCRCGGIHCIDGPGLAVCPWCGGEGDYQPAPSGVALRAPRNAG